MESIPSNTLFIIIVILASAISISQFFPYRKEPLSNTFNINRITNILITFIIAFLIVIVFNLSPIQTNLIDDVLVGLSALLAFAAVVKSIQNGNMIEEKRKEDERKNTKIRLSVYLNHILEEFEILNFLEGENLGTYNDIQTALGGIKNTIEKDTMIFNYIKTRDMVSLLSALRPGNLTDPSSFTTVEQMDKSTKSNKELILSLQNRLTILVNHIASYNNIELSKY